MSKDKTHRPSAPNLHTATSNKHIPGTSLDQPHKTPSYEEGFILSTNRTKHPEKTPTHPTLNANVRYQDTDSLDSPPSTPLTPTRRLSLEALAPGTPTLESLKGLDLNDSQEGDLINYYRRGTELYAGKKYPEAVVQFDQALKIDNHYANAHYNKALALKSMGKFSDSLREHERALELNPENILYLCSKGRLHLKLHEHAEALKCFEDAYTASSSDAQTPSLSEKNQDFIHRMLTERSNLFEHIASLQKASIANQKIIDAYEKIPAFRGAVEHFKDLKTRKAELIDKCIDDLHSSTNHSSELDLGAPSKEVMSQQISRQNSSNSSHTKQLCKTIQTLSQQLALLEAKFLDQQKELRTISDEQEQLQDKTEEQDMVLEQQAEDIQRLERLAESLETNQQGIRALIHSFEAKGARNVNKLLEEMAELKHNLAGIIPDELNLGEYPTAFSQTLRQDLVAAQSAANLVTNSDIIRNSKTGSAGKVADFLDAAGDVIPSFGGYIQFFAAIISTADHTNQQQLVSKLSGIATTPLEMEKIAYNVAKILSDPKYFDKSLIESNSQSLKTKVINYLYSFVEELADGSQTSNAHNSTAIANVHETHTKYHGIFRKTKSFSEGASPHGRAEESEEHSHRKFFLFPRKSKTGPVDEEATRASETTTLTKSIDFLQRSRDISAEHLHQSSHDSTRSTFWKIFSPFKAKKSSTDSTTTEEELGINNAHLISAMIISGIYKDQVHARSFQTNTSDIIEEILNIVFEEFPPVTPISQILSQELTYQPEVSIKAETEPSPALNKKLEAKKMAVEILDEVKKQAAIEIPEKFNGMALHAISSRIETEYSSNKKPIMESMMESSTFKIAFINRLISTLVEQINATGNPKINLTSARKAIKATEEALGDEGDDFPIDTDPAELLVWHLAGENTSAVVGDSIELYGIE